MPFKKGQIKVGGRQKGTLNKVTIEQQGRAAAILELLESQYLEKDIKALTSSQRAAFFSDLLEYCQPKLSRVDNRILALVNISDEPITFE